MLRSTVLSKKNVVVYVSRSRLVWVNHKQSYCLHLYVGSVLYEPALALEKSFMLEVPLTLLEASLKSIRTLFLCGSLASLANLRR